MSAGINPESLFGCVRELQTASDSAQFLALEQQLGEEVRRASVAGADLSGDDRATLRDNALSVFHSCFEHSARLPQLVHAQLRVHSSNLLCLSYEGLEEPWSSDDYCTLVKVVMRAAKAAVDAGRPYIEAAAYFERADAYWSRGAAAKGPRFEDRHADVLFTLRTWRASAAWAGGAAAAALKESKAAAELLRHASVEHEAPNLAMACFNRGAHTYNDGRAADAVPWLDAAAGVLDGPAGAADAPPELRARHARTLVLLALAYLDLDQHAKALSAAGSSLAAADTAEALVVRANALLRMQRPAEAAEAVLAAVRHNDCTVSHGTALCAEATEAGGVAPAQAAAAWAELARRFPDEHGVGVARARALLAASRWDEAAEAVAAFSGDGGATPPSEVAVREMQACVWHGAVAPAMAREDHEASLAWLRRYDELLAATGGGSPANRASCARALGLVLLAVCRPEEALAEARRAAELTPNAAATLCLRARCLLAVRGAAAGGDGGGGGGGGSESESSAESEAAAALDALERSKDPGTADMLAVLAEDATAAGCCELAARALARLVVVREAASASDMDSDAREFLLESASHALRLGVAALEASAADDQSGKDGDDAVMGDAASPAAAAAAAAAARAPMPGRARGLVASLVGALEAAVRLLPGADSAGRAQHARTLAARGWGLALVAGGDGCALGPETAAAWAATAAALELLHTFPDARAHAHVALVCAAAERTEVAWAAPREERHKAARLVLGELSRAARMAPRAGAEEKGGGDGDSSDDDTASASSLAATLEFAAKLMLDDPNLEQAVSSLAARGNVSEDSLSAMAAMCLRPPFSNERCFLAAAGHALRLRLARPTVDYRRVASDVRDIIETARPEATLKYLETVLELQAGEGGADRLRAEYPRSEAQWLVARSWNRGVAAYHARQHATAERFMSTAMRLHRALLGEAGDDGAEPDPQLRQMSDSYDLVLQARRSGATSA